MKYGKALTILVLLIASASFAATLTGILSYDGPGKYEYETIRGEKVIIYGKGLYQHMSADVAVQGIAQDYVTLFIGIPLLLISLYFFRKNHLTGLFLLAGTLGYFLVTYLFYLTMGMYNEVFLVYAFLLGTTFFAFLLSLFSLNDNNNKIEFKSEKIIRYSGYFLILNAVWIGMLWLSIVVPPLLDGTIIPKATEHYTTLIVQGFDLGLLLPLAFVVGYLAIQKNYIGILFSPVYIIFLSLLMIALVSKLLFMAEAGQNVFPAIFIIPAIAAAAISFSVLLLKNFKRIL